MCYFPTHSLSRNKKIISSKELTFKIPRQVFVSTIFRGREKSITIYKMSFGLFTVQALRKIMFT